MFVRHSILLLNTQLDQGAACLCAQLLTAACLCAQLLTAVRMYRTSRLPAPSSLAQRIRIYNAAL